VHRVSLTVGISGLAIGLWTFFEPASFYADFPVSGAAWVSRLGQYNEHLTVDFGSAQIGLAIAAIVVSISRSAWGSVAVLGGFLVFGVLHFSYHLGTFDAFSPGSAAAQAVALATFLVLPAAALVGIYTSQRKGTRT
jgi:hypothetical protein